MEETKHEIYCLGFKWCAKYTAQNDLVDLYHSIYHLQLQNGLPALREKCPNTALFLVLIFPHLDWIRRDTAREVSKYGVISGPYFPAFGLNTERYVGSLRTQSECVKIRTRNNSVFGHFSRSVALYVFFGIFPKYWISYVSEHLKYVNI